MKEYRKKIKLRMRSLIFYNLLLLILVALGLFKPTAGINDAALGFMSGFNVGFCLFIQMAILSLLVTYGRALKDVKKLETLYIYENDERRKFIQSQIGGVAINILLAVFALGTIGAGFLNQTVFFSLLAALFATALVKGSLKIYFSRKV